MKIDVHGHYFPPAYKRFLADHRIEKPDGFPAPEWSEDIQKETMDALGITYACLSISSPHIHMGDAKEAITLARSCNEYGVGYAKRSPEKIGIFASLPLPEIQASIAEVEWCAQQPEIKGFCLLTNSNGCYLGHPDLAPVMAALNEINAVVAIHPTMPQAIPAGVTEILPTPFMEFFFDTTRTVYNLIINHVIRDYPNIKWIVPHAGAVIPSLSDRIQSLPMVLHQPELDLDVFGSLSSLYYDLSGTSMPKQYDILRTIAGEDHLLYGSDAPFTPLPADIKMAEAMDKKLPEQLQQKVYVENARTGLGIGKESV